MVDRRARAAERMRKLHADPEFKAATAERMRKLHADPEFKAKVRAGRWQCPAGYESVYRKAAAVLGAKVARQQIEALARNEAARTTRKTLEPIEG